MSVLHSFLHFAAQAAAPLLDFIYPPHCHGCGTRIRPEDVLCPECMTDLAEIPWDEGHLGEARERLRVQFAADSFLVGYAFEPKSVLQECIHAMKYRGMHAIAFWFGRLLGERLHGTTLLHDAPLLLPVPLHPVKRIERGYNQSERLCRGIAFETGLELAGDFLVRTRYTKSQAAAKLHAGEREKNVKDAFSLRRGRENVLAGRSVILVDDLITTGATTGACVEALRAARAGRISVLAHAMPVGQGMDNG